MREICTFSNPSQAYLNALARSEIEEVAVVNIMTGQRWIVRPVFE